MQSTDYDNENENDNYKETFDNDDFVFTQKDGQYVGGGYKVQSMFLDKGISPVTTFNTKSSHDQDGGKISTPFENLAVPAGLFYINQRTSKKVIETPHFYEQHETISDDIFDKLFGLVNADNNQKKHKKTKRSKHHSNKLTKRRK